MSLQEGRGCSRKLRWDELEGEFIGISSWPTRFKDEVCCEGEGWGDRLATERRLSPLGTTTSSTSRSDGEAGERTKLQTLEKGGVMLRAKGGII